MDNQFEPLRGDLSAEEIHLDVCSESEHVREIEFHNRTLKERTRSVVGVFPFERLPGWLIVELVHYVTFWLNIFPPSG